MSTTRSTKDYFNKRFEFVGNENWYLPMETYKSSPWKIDSLLQMKSELNHTKGQLSSFDLSEWSDHTKSRDPSVSILHDLRYSCNIEVLTQAWVKFYECLCTYDILPEEPPVEYALKSLHLCEAPGGFVSALNHFLGSYYERPVWNWIANSLNPYYEGNSLVEMIADDRLIKHTRGNWNFGVDQSGDLTRYCNHEDMVQNCCNITLVTADGSVDCIKNPGEQENTVNFLHYCETMTALRVLNKSGCFILKLFTIFEHGTICLLYLLNCVFKNVHVFKPSCSKSGNSEVYVICLNFKGANLFEHLLPTILGPYRHQIAPSNYAMFPLNAINPDFITQLEKCCAFFKDEQCFTINENVKYFKMDANNSEFKDEICAYFKQHYMIVQSLPNSQKLIKRNRVNTNEFIDSGSSSFVLDNTTFQKHFLTVIPVFGKAIIKVLSSRFISDCRGINSLHLNEDQLLNDMQDYMPKNYFLVRYSSFKDLPQYIFQRMFFTMIQTNINDFNDILVVGVPLLTRFLVDVMFILGFGFKNVIIYKKGIILFQKPIKGKIEIVHEYFNAINSIYASLNVDKYLYQFEPDILQLLSDEHLYKSGFRFLMCKYNDSIYNV